MELDLFFGPGGVGKTTLSACHALRAAERGERVLLISVDPLREEDMAVVVKTREHKLNFL